MRYLVVLTTVLAVACAGCTGANPSAPLHSARPVEPQPSPAFTTPVAPPPPPPVAAPAPHEPDPVKPECEGGSCLPPDEDWFGSAPPGPWSMPTAPVPGTEEDPDFYPPFPETTLADPLPGSAPEDSDYRLRWRQVAVLLMMALALSLAYIVLITKEPKR